LSDAEIKALKEQAHEAAGRIGTEDEQRGAEDDNRIHGPDRRAVKIWRAVEEALA
jgi:hypothetical protein